MARCRLKGNFQQLISSCEVMQAEFQGLKGIRIRIFNEVEYTIFVEYGTSRMRARAMVRKSLPAIIKKIDELWADLVSRKFPFTQQDMVDLMEEAKKFALDEIRKRTPVLTRRLQNGFEGEVESY